MNIKRTLKRIGKDYMKCMTIYGESMMGMYQTNMKEHHAEKKNKES